MDLRQLNVDVSPALRTVHKVVRMLSRDESLESFTLPGLSLSATHRVGYRLRGSSQVPIPRISPTAGDRAFHAAFPETPISLN